MDLRPPRPQGRRADKKPLLERKASAPKIKATAPDAFQIACISGFMSPLPSSSNPHSVPSRQAFLQHNALAVLLCYLVAGVSNVDIQPERNAVLFSPQTVAFSRLGSVIAEQLAIRVVPSLPPWLNIYFVTRMGYSMLAIVSVGTGLSSVSAWRPMFGPLANVCSV